MKTINNLVLILLAMIFAVACNPGIDPISAVDPGPDGTAPVVNVKTPAEGYEIKVPELVSAITIDFEVTDDIELGSISVKFDGTEIKTFSEADYKDYRRFLGKVTYDNVGLGNHTITITASDLSGKTTVKNVLFSKVSPYTPKYANEVFYMPFEGDYMEMISFKDALKTGNPGFAADGLQNTKAYQGAADSYLRFPIDAFKNDEFTVGLWVKVNASPDRSGILTVGASADSRNEGFRLFREGSASQQRIKLNVGMGAGESWNDGDVIDPRLGDWVHVAFTVTPTSNTIYLNGAPVRTSTMTSPVSWEGCSELVIGSGGPTFSYWNHKSDLSKYDDMRIFNKALTAEEIQQVINDDSPYVPKYNGEIFYMPFEESANDKISMSNAGTVGDPGYADGKKGKAYAGAADSYLTFPTAGLKGNEFSAAFWIKINSTPDRAGILTVGASADSRNEGFRLFREGSATEQRIKLNVGTGAGESWNDGGIIQVATAGWVHVAITISQSKNTIYFNGEEIRSADMAGFSWANCETLVIGSGGDTFSYWNHFSDLSLIDELRLFSKTLSADEVKAIFNAEK
ncbi:MAG: LamG domain-containing protein [Bacteroidetes bacterium]|nr:MAG: LamG domain-containing protein [Bacteroidota bacterium]